METIKKGQWVKYPYANGYGIGTVTQENLDNGTFNAMCQIKIDGVVIAVYKSSLVALEDHEIVTYQLTQQL